MILLGAWFTLLVAGCSAAMSDQQDSYVQDIYKRYPELKSRHVTVGEVKRVIDGDTFITKSEDRVRLIGVNTPETVKPNSPVEQFGKEASNFSKQKLSGKTVYLFDDAQDKDKYGRPLRYVFIAGEPVMFNETLVAEGYANPMTVPPNVIYAKMFVQREREARAKQKGLWAPN